MNTHTYISLTLMLSLSLALSLRIICMSLSQCRVRRPSYVKTATTTATTTDAQRHLPLSNKQTRGVREDGGGVAISVQAVNSFLSIHTHTPKYNLCVCVFATVQEQHEKLHRKKTRTTITAQTPNECSPPAVCLSLYLSLALSYSLSLFVFVWVRMAVCVCV